jgi:hypothetical protein
VITNLNLNSFYTHFVVRMLTDEEDYHLFKFYICYIMDKIMIDCLNKQILGTHTIDTEEGIHCKIDYYLIYLFAVLFYTSL